MDCPRLLRPWHFPGKNTGVGCHFLLQGLFLTQRSNLGLQHCRQMLYPLSHQGSYQAFPITVVPLIISRSNISSVQFSRSVVSDFCSLVDCSLLGSSVHGESIGKNTGVGSHSVLQGLFLTQRSKPGLLHCKQILYHLSQQGSLVVLYDKEELKIKLCI